MTHHRGRKPRAIAACVLGITLLSGCSASSVAATTTHSGQAPASTTAPTAAPAAAPASNAPAQAIDVCTLFPAAAASQSTGLDLSSSTVINASAGMYACSYASTGSTSADIESELNITVYTSASPVTLDALKTVLDAAASQMAPTVPIAGVGAKAYASDDGTIAQAGNYIVQVAGLVFDIQGDHTASGATAKAVLAALGQ